MIWATLFDLDIAMTIRRYLTSTAFVRDRGKALDVSHSID